MSVRSFPVPSPTGDIDWDVPVLLGRQEKRIAPDLLHQAVAGKRVLVTGGAGSIGRELVRQALAGGAEQVAAYDQSERGLFYLSEELHAVGDRLRPVLGSVLDLNRLHAALDAFRPEIIYHTAAYKHVPMLEENPCEGIQTNVFGTLNVLQSAMNASAKRFVLLSTDKAVSPVSVLGATKRLAEKTVLGYGGKNLKCCAVRFGNVLGSDGSAARTFLRQILTGGPVTLTHPEMTRFFMSIPEAAGLTIAAGELARGGEIFVLDMDSPVSICTLAKRMAARFGNGDVEIVYTGVRKGEKLEEKLTADGETLRSTAVDGIRFCSGGKAEDLTETLERLRILCEEQNGTALRELLLHL